ncbi:hypothetical protein [Variovorax terrae]|uniref:Uncharacterized protein n=1 Tax=Variovorax terrae TaxID=2923278 RepID=A0A9X2ANC3_9BURK|nr:hypothetical protein [Variovorax terrae]MCJ0764254.1 hypothetical protein [Variovorax terrae]
MKLIQSADELRQTAADGPPPQACRCSLGPCPGWESVTDERWPAAQMARLATLRDPALDEPSFEEHHPGGTRYDSPAAPVAVSFFPYNRCDLWRCGQCHRHLLRYTEFGGYYVDHRVRALDPALIAD